MKMRIKSFHPNFLYKYPSSFTYAIKQYCALSDLRITNHVVVYSIATMIYYVQQYFQNIIQRELCDYIFLLPRVEVECILIKWKLHKT